MLQRRATTVGLAALMAAGVAVTGLLAYVVPGARHRDVTALNGFLGLSKPHTEPLMWDIAHLADPLPYVLLGLAMVVVALARGRARVAIAIPLVLLAAGATTEALKLLTAAPRHDAWLGDAHIADASWPSGHATAAMALALCAVLASPPRWRAGVAALGVTFALGVSYSILALGWHFPSDVFGGFLVAAFWALVAVAALGGLQPSRVDARPAVGVAVGAAALAFLVAAEHPATVAEYAADHPTFVAGAVVIAALAASLAGLLAVGFGQRAAQP